MFFFLRMETLCVMKKELGNLHNFGSLSEKSLLLCIQKYKIFS